MEREDAFRTLGFTGSGTATSRLSSRVSPSIAWRKTTKSALRETLSSHMGMLKGQVGSVARHPFAGTTLTRRGEGGSAKR